MGRSQAAGSVEHPVLSDLVQISAANPDAADAASGTLTLAYADQTFELASGQSRSFKQSEGQRLQSSVQSLTKVDLGDRLQYQMVLEVRNVFPQPVLSLASPSLARPGGRPGATPDRARLHRDHAL